MTRRARSDDGLVTAELATIAPLGIAFAVLLLWVVSWGHTQVQLTDAARETARLVARGESIPTAEAVAREQLPDDAAIEVVERDGLVTVTVSAHTGLPGAFSDIASREVEATAVAASEQS